MVESMVKALGVVEALGMVEALGVVEAFSMGVGVGVMGKSKGVDEGAISQ